MGIRQLPLGLLTCLVVFGAGKSHAGAYTFAGESNGINVVTHAKGYSGTGGSLDVKVCIVPGTPNAASMVVPLSNSVDRFNLLVPTIGNIRQFGDNDIDFSAYDFESVLTHELGHCQGLAHVNLATESGLSGDDRNFTKATDGTDNTFNIDDGADNVIGSADDVRGDDVNLHWFFIGGNNPFVFPATPESTNYSRDVSDLPVGDNWVTNADRDVSTSIFGLPATESVMQQGTFNDEDQRALAADDVATLQHARTGLDRQAGTADDYTVNLIDGGISSTDCDINISFDDTETGFAVCKSGGTFVSGDVAITTANSFYNTTAVTWHFGTRYIPLPGADNISVANGGSTSSLDGGGSSLLTNDTDQQGDGLLLSSATYFGPDSGAVTLNANGTFTYTHDGSATTSDRFVYRVCSDNGSGAESNACAHQYVYVTVAGSGNTPPTAVDDAIDATRGGTATTLTGGGTSLLANDSDPDTDGLSLTTTPVSGPGNGSVTLFSNGTFSYTHDNSLTASDTFDYQVCDDGTPSECSTATVNITIDLGDVACSSPAAAIPDGDAGGVSDTINVTDTEVLSDLNVTLNISHAYVGDLSATLTHVATGTEVDLLDRPGVPASTYGCSNDNVETIFDDEGAAPAEDACDAASPAIGGTLTPAGTLSDFDGESFAGDWTLLVTDSVTPDPGTLNSWCLDPTTNGNAPIALADGPGGAYVVDEGQGVTLSAAQLKSNDTDAEDGTPAGNVSLESAAVNGSVVDNGNQTFTYTHNGSETSSGSFQYRVADSDGLTSNLATVSLTVNPENDAPVATADGPGGVFGVDEGDDVTLSAAQLTANDSDAEDGTPGGDVSVVGGTTNGGIVDNGNQTFTFTHDGSETASGTFQYQVEDAGGQSSNTVTVTLNVVSQNDPPVATNDGPGGAFVVNEGQDVTISRASLTGNDTDAEDGTPSGSLALVGSTTNGSVVDNGNDTYTFTHDGSETLTASFQYEIDDAAGATSNVATVNLTVTPQKDSPVANDDGPGGAFVVVEGDAVTLSAAALKANDTDEEDTIPAGDVSLAGATTNGAVQDNGNQTFTFTHDGSETVSAAFQYSVQDADGLDSNTATVNLQVTPSNDSPVAVDDGPGGVFSVAENGDVTVSAANLTGNDSDAEDGTPGGVVSLTGSATNGSVVDNGNQTFTFSHDGTQSTSASFEYQVADSNGDASNTATVNLAVSLTNDSPVANDDGPGGAFVVGEGATVVLTAAQLAANDTDSEDGLPGGDVFLVGSGTNGSVIDNGNQTFSFTQDGSESATAAFSYRIEDSQGLTSNTATVTLTVNPSNDAPLANDDGPGGVFTVDEAADVTLTAAQLVANDSDAEDGVPGGVVTLAGVAVDGSVADNGNQTFTFTHDGSQNLLASFQYTVDDSDGAGSNVATVTLSVTPAGGGNASPVAVDDSIAVVLGGTTTELAEGGDSLLDNDSDPDFDNLAVTLTPLSAPTFGEVTLQGDGTFSYSHDGSLVEEDSFVYEVCDDGVPALCASATVTIAVDLGQIECAVPGVAIPDGDVDGVTDTITVPNGAVLSDLDVALAIDHSYIGDLTAVLTHVDSGTSVTLLERPGRADSGFGCDNPDIDVVLDDEADDPAEDACSATPPAMSGTLYPLGLLSDFDGLAYGGDWTLNVSDAVSADTGTLQSWCLVPSFGENAPIALDDGPGAEFAVVEGQSVTLSASALVANDSDAEDGIPAGLVSLAGVSTRGAVVDNADQTFTFTHDGSESGADGTFQYQVADADGFLSNVATVSLTVIPVQTGPTAVDDAAVTAPGVPVVIGVMANDRPGDNALDASSVVISSDALNGEVELVAGVLTYIPDPGFSGVDEFTYNIADVSAQVSNDATTFVLVGELVHPASCGPNGQRVRAFQSVFLETAEQFGAGAQAFEALGLPESLTIDAATGVLTGVPTPAEVSAVPYRVIVSALDGAKRENFEFDLTVDADADVMMFDSYELSCFAPGP